MSCQPSPRSETTARWLLPMRQSRVSRILTCVPPIPCCAEMLSSRLQLKRNMPTRLAAAAFNEVNELPAFTTTGMPLHALNETYAPMPVREVSESLPGYMVSFLNVPASTISRSCGRRTTNQPEKPAGSPEHGQTLPSVGVPHGMNLWTPQTRDTEQKCIAPYYFSDPKLQGFRNSHWIVGGCTQDYGSMTLHAMSGKLRISRFSRSISILPSPSSEFGFTTICPIPSFP